MEDLKVGDIVKLKSGGPLMTIQSFSVSRGARIVRCTWFVNDDVKSESFTPDALLKQN